MIVAMVILIFAILFLTAEVDSIVNELKEMNKSLKETKRL